MKPLPFFASIGSLLTALIVGLFICPSSQANVIGVNTPGTSFASINFVDTSSTNSSSVSGTTNVTQATSPWNGSSWTLPGTTDGITNDFAKGNLNSFFGGTNYGVTLNSIGLRQLATNTGSALLRLQFNIEFQLDAAGLPLQPTLYPNFLVNGTVQPTFGSFASVVGFINYYGVDNTANITNWVETVNYNQTWNTPGPIIGAIVAGTPVNFVTPTLAPNTRLTLIGDIRFTVDPASITVETVPEPSTWAMVLMGFGVVAFRAFRRKNLAV